MELAGTGRDGMEGFGGSRETGTDGTEGGGPKPGMVGRERDAVGARFAVCTVCARFDGAGVGAGGR